MTSPDSSAHQGYLLLAGISGYTAFLTGTELEHVRAIIGVWGSMIASCWPEAVSARLGHTWLNTMLS